MTVNLRFDGSQSCFLHCSPSTFSTLFPRGTSQPTVVTLLFGENTTPLILAVKVNEQQSDKSLVLNKTLADLLGAKEGNVQIKPIPYTVPATAVTVTCSPDDYSLVVLQRQQVEELVLNQVKAIQKDKPILVWLSPSNFIKFVVTAIEPSQSMSINGFTRLSITDRVPVVPVKCEPKLCSQLLSKVVFTQTADAETSSLAEVTISCFCKHSVPMKSHALIRKINQLTDADQFLCYAKHCKNCLKSKTIFLPSYLGSFFSQNEVIVLQLPTVSVIKPLLEAKYPIFEGSTITGYAIVSPPIEEKISRHWVTISDGQLAIKKTETLTLESPNAGVNPHSLIYERIVDHLLNSLPFTTKSMSLLSSAVPSHGAGKTYLCQLLRREPRLRNFFISYHDATALRGKRIENVVKEIGELLSNCSYHQPSLLILDNLDAVLPARSKNEDASGDELFGTRLAAKLVTEFKRFLSCNVEVLITTQTDESCHYTVRDGCDEVFTLPLLTSAHQMPLLRSLVTGNEKEVKSLLSSVSLKSSLTVGEVVKLAKSLNAHTGQVSEVCKFLELERKKAASDNIVLEDCGGLHEAKDELHRMLVLPFRFPDLFSQIPFQLNRGLLLFGPPGVGKTHLVKAIASDLDMSFITVKGPELLSKYIGASEDAVRALFRRARESSPALVFFDEFDSLAPCRGNDTTGVMDRVVNQLLTELDGIVQQEGVFVVAATSRPDTLDPAILRPGRIGKKVFCPMPSVSERVEIWNALLRLIPTDSTVNTQVLAGETAFYSGADMKAVLYNAQLAAVRAGKGSQLSQDYLVGAIRDTKPSLRKDDLHNYESIYDNFLVGNVTNVGYKTTLR
eukprot:sb/3462057/